MVSPAARDEKNTEYNRQAPQLAHLNHDRNGDI